MYYVLCAILYYAVMGGTRRQVRGAAGRPLRAARREGPPYKHTYTYTQ